MNSDSPLGLIATYVTAAVAFFASLVGIRGWYHSELHEALVKNAEIRARVRTLSEVVEGLTAENQGWILVSSGGKVLSVSDAVLRIFGYEEENLVGETIELLVPKRSRGLHPKLRREYAIDPRMRPMGTGRRVTGLHRDGSELEIEITLAPAGVDFLAVISAPTQ
jgi:PAS domain S-box-containing protein